MLQGRRGALWSGGRLVARLGRWSWAPRERLAGGWHLEAELLERDEYWSEWPAPLTLELESGGRTYRAAVERCQLAPPRALVEGEALPILTGGADRG
jgi:hypothetical protein